MMTTLLNLAAMQISWFACVLGAAHGLPWLGVPVALVAVIIHLLRAPQKRMEVLLIAVSLSLGLVVDSALATTGLISFVSGTLIEGLTTPWMLGLWVSFATALTTSLRWIVSRPAIAVLFGALGGPAAYWSGAKLGAITLDSGMASIGAIAIGWAGAMGAFALIVSRHKANVGAVNV